MRQFFIDHGFTENKDDSDILEAEFHYEDSAELAEGLGIFDEFDTLIIQVNVENETAVLNVDGDCDSVDISDIQSALEGEFYD